MGVRSNDHQLVGGKQSFDSEVQAQGDVRVDGNLYVTGTQENINNRATTRWFLEEYFTQKPGINADIQNSAEATRMIANPNFEVLGTNADTADVTFAGAAGTGIKLETDGADEDSIIIAPHLDTSQTAWSATTFNTEDEVEWSTAITTGTAITDVKIWGGLKLTNDGPVVVTDDDQAYFLFATDADNGTALTTFANLHFVYSIGGTDYITDLGIALAALTTYRLKIKIDANRQVSVFVNDVQYGLAQTAGSTGGTASSDGVTKSLALTDNVALIPYVGIEAGAAAAKHMYLHYESISRNLVDPNLA